MNENLPVPSDASGDPVMTVYPAVPETVKGLNPMAYVHSLRRHWLLALTLGVICGAVLGYIGWKLRPEEYTAVAQLRIHAANPQILFSTADARADSGPGAFEIYRDTQQLIIKSRFVLTAALRNDAVKGLPSIEREEERHNTLAWLTENLNVVFPVKNAEIMQISMTSRNPRESATIVNAVVQAYLDEVVTGEQQRRKGRYTQLQTVYAEKENEVRVKRNELKSLAEQLGTTETETLTLQQQRALREYDDLGSRGRQLDFDLTRVRGRLDAQREQLRLVDEMEISDADVERVGQWDPLWKPLSEQHYARKTLLQENQLAVVPGTSSRYLARSADSARNIDAQYEDLRRKLRERVRAERRQLLQQEISRDEVETKSLEKQKRQIAGQIKEKGDMIEKIGRSSIDIQMLQAELKQLDQVLSSVGEERERLRVELNSGDRIEVLGKRDRKEPAEIPEDEDARNQRFRYLMALVGVMLGFVIPGLVFIVLPDVQKGIVNSVSEVSEGLGLRVAASLPKYYAGMLGIHHWTRGGRQRWADQWRNWRDESVDALAARLLRKADQEQMRVLMISSAMADEGKESLSTDLAVSMARRGRRTVLVDFNLREPWLSEEFEKRYGVPVNAEPGVCEILRGRVGLPEAVQPVSDELSLAVVTAGHADPAVVASLSQREMVESLLGRLRDMFDFVILDGSPILPTADARLVSQHVDGVFLSVLCDKSRGDQVREAHEILEAFGTRPVEIVVTRNMEPLYGGPTVYEAAVVADVEPPHLGEDDANPFGDPA
jgi:capsular exopolysaccharide synthesis family protein